MFREMFQSYSTKPDYGDLDTSIKGRIGGLRALHVNSRAAHMLLATEASVSPVQFAAEIPGIDTENLFIRQERTEDYQ